MSSWLGSGNLAIKREAFERVGGFDAAPDRMRRRRSLQPPAAGRRTASSPTRICAAFTSAIPRTLKALFFGELWRGRDNLRVTFSGPRTFRHLRSALMPIVDLALPRGRRGRAAAWAPGRRVACSAALAAGAGRRSRPRAMVRRRICAAALLAAAQALAVALVFDLGARAGAAGARQPSRAADGVT